MVSLLFVSVATRKFLEVFKLPTLYKGNYLGEISFHIQLAFTFLNLTTETLEQDMNFVQS